MAKDLTPIGGNGTLRAPDRAEGARLASGMTVHPDLGDTKMTGERSSSATRGRPRQRSDAHERELHAVEQRRSTRSRERSSDLSRCRYCGRISGTTVRESESDPRYVRNTDASLLPISGIADLKCSIQYREGPPGRGSPEQQLARSTRSICPYYGRLRAALRT